MEKLKLTIYNQKANGKKDKIAFFHLSIPEMYEKYDTIMEIKLTQSKNSQYSLKLEIMLFPNEVGKSEKRNEDFETSNS